MAQDLTSVTGLDCFEESASYCADADALSQGDKEYDDILELNQFDGLPYSSRFYKLLGERKELPVWKAKCDFMDALAKEQFVSVTGSAKTGRSSQVSRCHGSFCHAQVQPGSNWEPENDVGGFFCVCVCAYRSPSGAQSSACRRISSTAWWSAPRPRRSRR